MDADLVTPYCNISNTFGDLKEYARQNEYAFKGLAAAKRPGWPIKFPWDTLCWRMLTVCRKTWSKPKDSVIAPSCILTKKP
ncbi:MAG: hypothetical protein IPP39_07560 [Chitinophagaceae bacterium]|nr:hypothetical protein [Chitinophagaceae bacterium]